jgi:hypothetical protein
MAADKQIRLECDFFADTSIDVGCFISLELSNERLDREIVAGEPD